MIRYYIRLASLLGVLTFSVFALSAQKNDYFWVFSRSNTLDFRYDPPKIDTLPFYENSECAASIADDVGNLLFYLDAVNPVYKEDSNYKPLPYEPISRLRDYKGQIIRNGDRIKTYASISQAVILPIPGKINEYTLFCLWNYKDEASPTFLYQYIVKGSREQGFSVSEEKQISDSLYNQKIAAVRHGNGVDWWIFLQDFNGGIFYRYLLSAKGLKGPFTQVIPESRNKGNFRGEFRFSPNGNYLLDKGSNQVFLLDRCSGKLKLILDSGKAQQGHRFKSLQEFSANSRFIFQMVYPFKSDTNTYIFRIHLEDGDSLKIGDILDSVLYKQRSNEIFGRMLKLTSSGYIYMDYYKQRSLTV